MARDYDYLFKLLIIGDSGKATLGMSTGSGPVAYFVCFVLLEKCSSVSTVPALYLFSRHIVVRLHEIKAGSLQRPPPPYFCGADRAEVVCPGWVY